MTCVGCLLSGNMCDLLCVVFCLSGRLHSVGNHASPLSCSHTLFVLAYTEGFLSITIDGIQSSKDEGLLPQARHLDGWWWVTTGLACCLKPDMLMVGDGGLCAKRAASSYSCVQLKSVCHQTKGDSLKRDISMVGVGDYA
jgi:hypothetical protein